MSTELVIHPRIAQWTVEALTRLVATYAIIQGIAVAMSRGTARFSAEQYSTAVDLPGFPESWGMVLALAGVLSLAGSLLCRCTWVVLGSFVISAWSFFFALSVLDAVLDVGAASYTPIFVHGAVGLSAVVLAMTYNQSRKR